MTELEQAIMDVIRNEVNFDQVAIKVFHMTNEEATQLHDALIYELEEKCAQTPIMRKVFDLIKTDPVQYAKPWIDRFNLQIDKKIIEFMGTRRRQDESIARRRAIVAHLEALIQ